LYVGIEVRCTIGLGYNNTLDARQRLCGWRSKLQPVCCGDGSESRSRSNALLIALIRERSRTFAFWRRRLARTLTSSWWSPWPWLTLTRRLALQAWTTHDDVPSSDKSSGTYSKQ